VVGRAEITLDAVIALDAALDAALGAALGRLA
jgi:hypothetical protein